MLQIHLNAHQLRHSKKEKKNQGLSDLNLKCEQGLRD